LEQLQSVERLTTISRSNHRNSRSDSGSGIFTHADKSDDRRNGTEVIVALIS